MLQRPTCLILFMTVMWTTVPVMGAEANPQAEQERFFETHIRPILVEKCQECHGSKKQWAELRLDTRDMMLKGGETGPAIVPGKPDDSRLIQVIRYSDDDSQMPPDGKLSDEQIARLTEWVSRGAVWPSGSQEAAVAQDYFQQAKSHWAFQPVSRPPIPAAPMNYRTANAVDHFIVEKLQEKNLQQSPQLEPQKLLRRLSFDLNGLPPSFEQVQAFAADPSSQKWQAEVDRMLASADFGQKWARYWLDIARYADTKGYVFTEERRYPFAYTYRDYVIKAFNEDLPYDQFIREQLAADLLPEKRSEESLAALGFLTVGQRFLNRQVDIIDDRIDVTTRGLLGMTLACSRCHDHKFDPLEAADYYALYGVFDSSYEPEQLPQIGEATDQKAYAEYMTELGKRKQELDDYNQKHADKVNAELQEHLEDYLLAILSDTGHQQGSYKREAAYEIRRKAKDDLLRYLRSCPQEDPVFGVWRRVLNLKDAEFAEAGRQRIEKMLAEQAEGKYQGNALVIERLKSNPPANMYDLARMYAELFRLAVQKDREVPEAEKPAWEQLQALMVSDEYPLYYTADEMPPLYHRDERNQHRNLEKKIDALMVTSAGAPPRAMVMLDKENPVKPVIFKRGNPGLRGDAVDRRFLKVLDFVRKEPFSEKASGRLELANAIASPENPLTARVLVNRIWMQLIGQPLVESTDDFGLRTPAPTHPELLDYLAYEFMQHNWSLKWLIREIVTSETYRQTSLANANGMQVDLENRLVWRMNRKRLPFESMRDAMLLSAGELDTEMYGRPEELEGKNPTKRRTIYGFIDRNNVSNLLRTFDVAGPTTSVSERPETSVPQQTLYMLNAPFVMELAGTIAKEQLGQKEKPTADKIDAMYQQILQRNPEAEERAMCVEYLQADQNSEKAWEELAQTLLLTNEFLFVD